MKIGIVTFWQTRDNYGQMLQCLALQYKLKEMGHDPYLIRYAHSEYQYSLRAKIVYAIKKILKFDWSRLKLNGPLLSIASSKDKSRDFDGFRNTYIKQSQKKYYSLAELRNDPPSADCYIVGSDQVWSRSLDTDDGKVFYLEFGAKSIKKVAYAVSFGNVVFDRKRLKQLKCRSAKFDFISVRESEGMDVCSQAGISATHVLDPTMLLPPQDYISLLNLGKKKEETIFIYALNISAPDELGWDDIKNFADKANLSVKITPSSGYIQGGELFGDNEKYYYSSISEWCSTILSSKLVVTTSFHGVVFCILFHTPFVYVPLKGRFSKGNNRVLNLLEMLNLQRCIYHEGLDYFKFSEMNINWQVVDDILEEYRNKSIFFLKSALK